APGSRLSYGLPAAGQQEPGLGLEDGDELAGKDVGFVLLTFFRRKLTLAALACQFGDRAWALRSALRPINLRAACSFSEELTGSSNRSKTRPFLLLFMPALYQVRLWLSINGAAPWSELILNFEFRSRSTTARRPAISSAVGGRGRSQP